MKLISKNTVNKNLFLLLLSSAASLAQAQEIGTSPHGTSHDVKISFGGITNGTISFSKHAGDSLYFTDPWINHEFHVVGFHLALKCNGYVLKYLENKSDNHLTQEMKDELRELLPGCAVTFDAIRLIHTDDKKDVSRDFNMLMLKFVIE